MQQPPSYPPQQPYGPQQAGSQPSTGYTQYPQQQPYQQPPSMPPRKPSAPARFFRFVRRHPIVSGIVGVALIIMIIVASIQNAQAPTTNATPTATPALTQAQQAQATTAPTVAPTQAPTSAPTTAPVAIVATHGSPHLGGNISDFYGKYGQPGTTPSADSAPNNKPSMSVAWVIDSNNGYLLSVQYYTDTHLVYYISYVGPTSWSKGQYRDYLITNFAPPGTAINTQANQYWAQQGGDPYNPIAYDSAVGKFFLHISDGLGTMNTV